MFFICSALRVTNLVYAMIFKQSNPGSAVGSTWINIFAGLLCFCGSTSIVFLFATHANKLSSIKKNTSAKVLLRIAKYVFTVLILLLEFVIIGLVGYATSNIDKAVHAYYFSDAKAYGTIANQYIFYYVYVSYGLLAVIIGGYSFFIIFIFTQIGWKPRSLNTYKGVFVRRIYYLIGVTISVCLFWAVSWAVLFTVLIDTGVSYTNDEYYSNSARIWTTWFASFFQFFWVLFSVMAIAVVKQKTHGLTYESEEDSNSSKLSSKTATSDTSRTMDPSITSQQ